MVLKSDLSINELPRVCGFIWIRVIIGKLSGALQRTGSCDLPGARCFDIFFTFIRNFDNLDKNL